MFRILLFFLVFIFTPPGNASPGSIGVATAHPLATEAGIDILNQGGNAFDAAIAVSSVLAVVEPYSSGLGGGGFWLLHTAADNKDIMLDGREIAPEKATKAMYLDKSGKIIPGLSINGALSAGIPGAPAALAWLAKNKGKLPLSESLQAAIDHARNGFPADDYYRKMLGFRLDTIKSFQDSANTFLIDRKIPASNELIIQLDLAHTLELVVKHGRDGFYAGELAKKLVKGVQDVGGIWTLSDLASYKIKIRKPITATYKGMRITSATLPSSGGILLAEIFNILADYSLDKHSDADRVHIIAEAMRRAYRDRAQYLGDTDFIDVPIDTLVSKAYALGLRQSMRLDKATPSEMLAPTSTIPKLGMDTTHFSIIDADGNRVAATLSINYPFGSGFIPEGTGVLLNDEMDDFSSKPGTPNVYGLVGNRANAIEPGKRMLSSMSPTFLEDEDRIAVIGTPGGSRIITMVLLGSLAFHEGKSAEEIVNLPRFHHQYLPDRIQSEPLAFSPEIQNALSSKGHELSITERKWGNMQVVIQEKKRGFVSAASDTRGIGKSVVISTP